MKQLIAKGEKILLRKYQLSDAFEDTKIWKNRKVSMWILDYSLPYNLKDARKWIKNILKNKKNYYAVLSKDSGNLIGAIWINHKKNKNGELGYVIRKEDWGKGYATEAIKFMTELGFKKLKLNRIYAKVNELNKGSIKVLKKSGFKLKKVLKKEGKLRFSKKLYNELFFELLKEKRKSKRV